MAALADADEVTLTLPIGICVVNIQRQLRPALNVVNVMDQISTAIPTLGFADLTFMPVLFEDLGTERTPLSCNVKRMCIPYRNQCAQP